MSEESEILTKLIKLWLNKKYNKKLINSSKLLNKKYINKLVNKFLNTEPFNLMKNDLLILSIINNIMKIEIYKILLNKN